MSPRQSGQAAVETAIVMPLFLFIVLGLLQLSLMHHARLMTKYAAYKAARSGALNRADLVSMENAAISVMLPLITRQSPIASGGGGTQPQYGLYKLSGPSQIANAFKEVRQSRSNKNTDTGKKIIEVTICHPLSSDLTSDKDFDDHRTNDKSDWRKFENTKLSVQVTTYLQLIIPFANGLLWWASYGKLDANRASTMKTLRMEHDGSNGGTRNTERKTFGSQPYTLRELKAQAEKGNYIMPVRANFSYRMHSNLDASASLPSQNECHVPFNKMN